MSVDSGMAAVARPGIPVGATCFVTCEDKLIRHLASHRRIQPYVRVTTLWMLITDLLLNRRIGLGAFAIS